MGVKKFWFLSKKTSWISATHVVNGLAGCCDMAEVKLARDDV